jgi:hypothetical protein
LRLCLVCIMNYPAWDGHSTDAGLQKPNPCRLWDSWICLAELRSIRHSQRQQERQSRYFPNDRPDQPSCQGPVSDCCWTSSVSHGVNRSYQRMSLLTLYDAGRDCCPGTPGIFWDSGLTSPRSVELYE